MASEKESEMNTNYLDNISPGETQEEGLKITDSTISNESTNSKDENDDNKEGSGIIISSSIRNNLSYSSTTSEEFQVTKSIIELLIHSEIGLKQKIGNKNKPTDIKEIIIQLLLKHPVKQWFYDALYKRLVDIVKEDITIDKIDEKNINILFDNYDDTQLRIKDLFLYKYENGKMSLNGNNVQLLQLIKNNKATDKVLGLLDKGYSESLKNYIDHLVENIYQKTKNKSK